MDTVISTPIGVLIATLLSWFAKGIPWWSIVFCVVLIVIPVLAIRWEKRAKERLHAKQREGFFLEPLDTIPDGIKDDDAWNSWLLKMEALLRGKGLKRKSDILSSIITRADPSDRPEIAENFFLGLARESMEKL